MTVVLTEIPGDSPVTVHSDGDDWEIRCGLTVTGSYTTGGDATFKTAVEAILKQQGSGTIIFVTVNGVPGYYVQYNYKTGKLQFFEGAAGVLKEIAEAAYPAAILEVGILRAFISGK